MTRVIEYREVAGRDIRERYVWLAGEAGQAVADRMAASVDQAALRLAEAPGIGTPISVERPDLEGMRKTRVPGFPNLMILYRADEERLEIVRILHTAQDWLSHLEGG